ncbi:MAG: hypothetical protein IJD11_01730, partial [Oscillospiraceae bacterium]|nr:hypothetical protein [Oscillospiraceae bacterium]
MSTRDIVMLVVSIVMIVVAVVVLAGVVLMNSNLFSEGELTQSIATQSEIVHKTKNFLIVGYDTDQESGYAYRHSLKLADVIMVMNYDITGKKANILQIPRDTYIADEYPTGKTNKINAVTNQSEKKGGGI